MALWLAGLIAGVIAGVVMAMAAMMVMPVMGRGLTYPVKLMAGTVQGEDALEGGPSSDMVGGMIHMMMSAVLGLIFGLIMSGLGLSGIWTLIIAGVIFALIVWVAMQYFVLPLVDQVMAQGMPPMAFAMTHVVFGVVLGLLTWVFH
jgi:hypothetical protein